jgi:ketosteroid isomerase-like protein
MANGAVGPFRGDPDDPETLKEEARNKETIRRYYKRVWNQQDDTNAINAIDELVTENFVIHRAGKVSRGRAKLKAQVTETRANFFDLRVVVEDAAAMQGTVAIRLSVFHKPRAGKHKGHWMRIRGVDISRVRDDRIAETSVSYRPQERVPKAELYTVPKKG